MGSLPHAQRHVLGPCSPVLHARKLVLYDRSATSPLLVPLVELNFFLPYPKSRIQKQTSECHSTWPCRLFSQNSWGTAFKSEWASLLTFHLPPTRLRGLFSSRWLCVAPVAFGNWTSSWQLFERLQEVPWSALSSCNYKHCLIAFT